MLRKNISQKGQALILVALGMIGLVGITALAIDGGNSFAERRRAQNAADTASLAGALEITQDIRIDDSGNVFNSPDNDTVNWYDATENLILENMSNVPGVVFTYDIPSVIVNSELLPFPGLDCKGNEGPYYQNSDYIQVLINIKVDTFFGKVVGINELESCVEAISYYEPPYVTELFTGNGIVAFNPGDLPDDFSCTHDGNEINGIKFEGGTIYNSTTASIFANSNCDPAIYSDSGKVYITSPSISAVGNIDFSPQSEITATLSSPVDQVPFPPNFLLPDPASDCGDKVGIINGMWGGPGNYIGYNDFPPGDVEYLEPGLYCVYASQQGFNVDNSIHGEGVTIALMEGAITWNSSSTIDIHAPLKPVDCVENDNREICNYKYNGLLIFIPETNEEAHYPTVGAIWNGNASWDLTGTVLAPWTTFKINGGLEGVSLGTQIMGYDFILTGTSTININYDGGNTWKGPYPAKIELSR